MWTLIFIVVFLVSATEIISSAETKPVLEFITRGGNDGRVLSRWTGQLVSATAWIARGQPWHLHRHFIPFHWKRITSRQWWTWTQVRATWIARGRLRHLHRRVIPGQTFFAGINTPCAIKSHHPLCFFVVQSIVVSSSSYSPSVSTSQHIKDSAQLSPTISVSGVKSVPRASRRLTA